MLSVLVISFGHQKCLDGKINSYSPFKLEMIGNLDLSIHFKTCYFYFHVKLQVSMTKCNSHSPTHDTQRKGNESTD